LIRLFAQIQSASNAQTIALYGQSLDKSTGSPDQRAVTILAGVL
jgi:hypothetical protein